MLRTEIFLNIKRASSLPLSLSFTRVFNRWICVYVTWRSLCRRQINIKLGFL